MQRMKKERRLKQSKELYVKIGKRIFDVVFSSIVLLTLSPVFILISILIIIDDGFPIIYRQQRSGYKNKPFYIYKFRSMKNEKDKNKKAEAGNLYNWSNGVPDDFVFKSVDDKNPNVTLIGRFLRKYSLDELPQFINVLKGDMSIIGPRPEILSISKHYSTKQQKRLEVKPGITGWAQVNGRSDIDHGEKIKHDLYYVDNIGIKIDLKILILTIIQVIFGRGAV